MIRVCLVAPGWMMGGQAVEARTLLAGFQDDPEARVEIQPIDPPLPRWLAAIPVVRTLTRMPLFWGGMLRRFSRCDVVHVFTAAFWPFLLTTTPAILVGRLMGRPVILNYRDGRARDHLRHAPVRWILRRATVLVFPSGYLRDVFREFGLEGRVVPNVVDTGRFTFRKRVPLRPVLLSSRLLEELYAVENTILAHAKVREVHPGAELIIVGDGDQRGRLEGLVADRNIGGVRFVGRVPHDEMPEWLDRAEILVNSSRIDNMPHCLIEAFAAGAPVVTTPSGGIPHIVQHEVNGLHVPIDDPEHMAAAILRLLAEPALVQRLVEAGVGECAARYSWRAARREWLLLYRAVTSRDSSSPGTD